MRWSKLTTPMRIAVLVTVLSMVAGFATAYVYIGMARQPKQPIPFSHRIHAGTKELSCFFCHPNASNSLHAGLPPMEKCLLCHDVIASKFEPIARIRRYKDKDESIPWVRVVKLPDYVHFPHEMHIAGGIDCGECHGNVKAMDRMHLDHNLDMNHCVSCHKLRNVSRDCAACHY